MWYIPVMEYSSAIKMGEVLMHTTARMSLGSTLGEETRCKGRGVCWGPGSCGSSPRGAGSSGGGDALLHTGPQLECQF